MQLIVDDFYTLSQLKLDYLVKLWGLYQSFLTIQGPLQYTILYTFKGILSGKISSIYNLDFVRSCQADI